MNDKLDDMWRIALTPFILIGLLFGLLVGFVWGMIEKWKAER